MTTPGKARGTAHSITATAAELQELAQWESKKANVLKAVTPILSKWEAQFTRLTSSYADELKSATLAHGLDADVVQKILTKEKAKIDGCKGRLFQLSHNACAQVLTVEVTNRQRTIILSEKITLIQAVVRRWLARRRYKELQKNERQRNKVAFEILETEKTYVKNLDILVRVFLEPLRQLSRREEPLITPDDLTKIFSNCEMISTVHKQLLESLEERMAKWSKTQLIGDIFVTWAPYLKFYTQYVGNYNTSLSTLAECKKKDEGVDAFFADCANNPETAGKYFGDYQILPVQRIPRYEMLVKELVKYTPKTHPDHANLESALSKIQAVASKINESKRVSENLAKLLSIQGLFAGKFDDLVQPHRNYLREGVVFYDNPRKAQREKSRKSVLAGPTSAAPQLDECYAFLMTDILILSHKKVSLLDDKMFRYSVVCVVTLLHATIEPLNNTPDSKVGFSLIVNQIAYSLYFDSPKAREDWMDTITKAAADLERNTSTLKKTDPEESPPTYTAAPKESKLSTLMHMAGELLPTSSQAPVGSPTSPVNLNPPGISNNSSNSPTNTPATIGPPSPQPTSRPSSARLSSGTSYVNLNTGSPAPVHRPPPAISKLKQVLALYEEVYQLEMAIFQVPIDLKTLFPQYYQQLPPNYQQLLWSRVFALKQKIEQVEGLRDKILTSLKSAKIATQLQHVIDEGKAPVGNLQSWVKETFPATHPSAQMPRSLVIALVKWLQSLLKAWEQIVEEECE